MLFNLIVTTDENNGIGFKGNIPWKLKEDLIYFETITTSSIVIMGRKTWESIPMFKKPLKRRINIILSNTLKNIDGVKIVKNYKQLFEYLYTQDSKLTRYVIGGANIYKYFLDNSLVHKIYLTKIFKSYKCDTYFPKLNLIPQYLNLIRSSVILTTKNKEISYQFREYTPYKHPNPYELNSINQIGEFGYLNMLKHIIEYGEVKDDRNGIGTKSLFGYQLTFNISESFPLLTTKKMFTKEIIGELLWVLKGSTNTNIFKKEQGINIWNGNSSLKSLDKNNLNHYEEGDYGPIYGLNFINYGSEYSNCKMDYNEQGLDQVKKIVNIIKENPNSRRILINLWNPTQLGEVVLPPCRVLYQFSVSSDGKFLSCSMYQKSSDVCIGVPYNIASASLLTYIIAKLTDKKPNKLIISLGNAHIYNNDIESLKQQITRNPYPFPILKIIKNIQDTNDLKKLNIEDFKIFGYDSYPSNK